MILFDTSFLIDLVNGDAGAVKLASEADAKGEIAALSVISMHEYLLGIYLAYYGRASFDEKLESAERDLSKFRILPLTKDMVRISSKIQMQMIRKGKAIGINDIHIGATALYYGAEMVSRNAKHLGEIPDLRLSGY